jgi:hypothetical protein
MNLDSFEAQYQAHPIPTTEDLAVAIQDEAWSIQDVPGCDQRVAELDHYVARVVQYLTYCIAGQESGDMLSRAKVFSIKRIYQLVL